MGSSIYHIGLKMENYNQNQELTVLSQAMYYACNLAMTRMQEEADLLGADGIIGVRLEVTRYEWGESLAEFIAVGTAVPSRTGQKFRNGRAPPFTSAPSSQGFWTPLRPG